MTYRSAQRGAGGGQYLRERLPAVAYRWRSRAAALNRLLAKEQELTRRGDQLTAERRSLPWVLIEKEYRFDTDSGSKTLPELFDGALAAENPATAQPASAGGARPPRTAAAAPRGTLANDTWCGPPPPRTACRISGPARRACSAGGWQSVISRRDGPAAASGPIGLPGGSSVPARSGK